MTLTEKETTVKNSVELLKELRTHAERTREQRPYAAGSVASFVEMLKNMPDVEGDVIDDARRKVEAGYYLSSEALDATASALLQEFIPEDGEFGVKN